MRKSPSPSLSPSRSLRTKAEARAKAEAGFRRSAARSRWIAVALALVTAAAYGPVLGFEFVGWDDFAYVSENPNVRQGLGVQSVRWAFTSVHGGHWHPLTSLSHILDWTLYGANPLGHHLTNVVLHVLNTVLLFGILEATTGAAWPSALVAALFALHPLHVESVAWISDRKDLLSTFFGFSSIAAYVAYARRPRAAPYVAALALFLLALMAKATMVILPVLLLLLDLWPLDRVGDRRRVLVQKLPFSALAALFGVIAVSVVRSLPETVEHGAQVAFADRAVNAVVSYARYLAKTIWPSGLAILYPHPNLPGGVPWATWHVAAAALVLLAITTGVAIERRRRPYLVVGWLWFMLGLFPVIGLLQIGPQAMADRYSYVPLVGIFLMVVWGGADLLAIVTPSMPAVRRMTGAGVALVLAAFLVVTERQIATWRDSHTLFARALEVAPQSAVLHSNFAVILRSEGKTDEAIEHYRAALAVEDDLPQTHYNLGNALASRRDLDEAIAHYRRATELDPRFVMAHYNLGGALRSEGRFSDAAESYRHALEVRPDFYQALNDLGLTLHSMGQLDGAVEAYRRALGIHASALTHRNLAKALASAGRIDEANEELHKAATAPPK